MVTRKPLPADAQIHPVVAQSQQPQPQDPSPWEDVGRVENATQPSNSYLDPQLVPESLRPGSIKSASQSSLEEENVWVDKPSAEAGKLGPMPSILRPGALQPKAATNPFLKRKLSGASPASSQDTVPQLLQPVASTPPTASFSNLALSEPSNNPWQPALDEKKIVPSPSPASDVAEQDSGKEVWGSGAPSRQLTPGQELNRPTLPELPSDEGTTPWADAQPTKAGGPLASVPPPTEQTGFGEDDKVWNGVAKPSKGKGVLIDDGVGGSAEDWDTLDDELRPASKQTTAEYDDAPEPEPEPEAEQPPLPPRRSAEQAPAPPPRPMPNTKSETYQIKNINWFDAKARRNPRRSPILVQNANGPCPLVALVNALVMTTPAEMTDTALIETLRSREQVSLGLLLDAVFDELMSPRRLHDDTALPDMSELYDFLKGLHTGMNVNPRFIPTEETVKMFKRTSLTHLHPSERGDMIPGTFEDTKEMDLYATFSIPLIHGWLPPKNEAVYEALKRRAVSYEDAQNLLFREEELEDKLSNTRQIGLTEEEQQVYQDILTIKSFLSISATQLTPWGLEVVTKAMTPGAVAILFRNDHFSTLYRHPQTMQLLTLVTDAGYATHDEVVWESLNDVNGEMSEFFSGDFLLVGGTQQQSESSIASARQSSSGLVSRQDNDAGWQTVQGRRGNGRDLSSTQSDAPPLSPTHEQEDRDLALAMQLQEEEDQRARSESERRQRESLLSEQFIEQQAQQSPNSARGGRRGGQDGARGGRGGPTLEPGRRTSSVSVPVTTTNGRGRGNASNAPRGRVTQPQPVRSLIPPGMPGTRRPADEEDGDAPPSYEQAAKATPYVPPEGNPLHPAASPDGRSGRSSNASASDNPGMRRTSGGGPAGMAGGPSTGPAARYRQGVAQQAAVAGGVQQRDKDCVVM
jgi:ubiquitin carboxyl-terminal hydrolase MINDY-1/2